jgi:hypothetical protein
MKRESLGHTFEENIESQDSQLNEGSEVSEKKDSIQEMVLDVLASRDDIKSRPDSSSSIFERSSLISTNRYHLDVDEIIEFD